MFEKIFKNFIDKELLLKTTKIYMYDNQGDYIYKVATGCKELLKQKCKNANMEIKRDIKNKVWLIFYKNCFIGAFE